MKEVYFLFLLLISTIAFGQSVFINEIHYDNNGIDTGEGFEIAGPAGTNLAADLYTVELYNGSGGSKYGSTITLTGIITNQQNGLGTIWFGADPMQNGSSDGLALIKNGVVIQFLSYEGVLTATSGTANGMTSTDIGVAESSSTPVGHSLQLIGSGSDYSDFTWSGPVAATVGAVNSSQTLPVSKNQIEGFAVYPNPVKGGSFRIMSSARSVKLIHIYDMLGKKVLSKEVRTNEEIRVDNLNTGIYILKVEQSGKLATRKLVIE